MSNGLGAGLLAIYLLGWGAILSLLLVTTALLLRLVPSWRRRRVVRVGLLAVLIAVLGPTAFGVVALGDEAPLVAVLLVAIVLLPLAVAALASRQHHTGWPGSGATAMLVWGAAYPAGIGVLVGGFWLIGRLPVGQRADWLWWAAVLASGAAVAVAAHALGRRVGDPRSGELLPLVK